MAMAAALADGQQISHFRCEPDATGANVTAESIESLRAGDAGCWERLLIRMERRALALSWRILNDAHLAADAVQNAFVKAYTRRSALHAGSDVERWLLAIVANAARDMARQNARAHGRIQGNAEELAQRAEHAAPEVCESEMEQRLRVALSKLDEESRVLFLLVHQEGFSYEAVAKELGWPLGTVRSTLHRARLRLRELLRNRRGESGS